jgi:hypothetical protein
MVKALALVGLLALGAAVMIGTYRYTKAQQERSMSEAVAAAQLAAREAEVQEERAAAARETAAREAAAREATRREATSAQLHPAPAEAAPLTSVAAEMGDLTLRDVVRRAGSGRASLFVLYSTDCPRSRAAFPQVVQLLAASSQIEPLVFAVDSPRGEIQGFLASQRTTVGGELIEAWAPGELAQTLGELGINVGTTWTAPLIAVLGPNGKAIAQWQGATDLRPVQATLQRQGWM